MALHSQRKRRQERDAREASGESIWTEELEPRARIRLSALWELFESLAPTDSTFLRYGVGGILKREGGWPADRVTASTIENSGNSDLVLDIVGAWMIYMRSEAWGSSLAPRFETWINALFEDHRIAFRIVDGEVIPFESDELHKSVVEPTLRLLVDARFDGARTSYLKALKEIPVDPAGAITDAGTALQEALEALGCNGPALGALIADARRKGLLGDHDGAGTEAIEKFLVWAASIRNNTGDGHHATTPSRGDAWLMVHLVGALIVRLADDTPRSSA